MPVAVSSEDDDFLPPARSSGTSKKPSVSQVVPFNNDETSDKVLVQALEFRVRKIESQLLQQDDANLKAIDDLKMQVASGLSEITSLREKNDVLTRQYSAIKKCFDCMICTNTVSWALPEVSLL